MDVAVDVSNRPYLVYRVDQGPVYRVRDITVKSEGRTREKFIRSRIPIQQGEVADQSDISEAIDRLYRTGVFRAVSAKPSV